MTQSDPYITVTCDNPSCRASDEVGLTRTGRGWDDRNVEAELSNLGWITDGFLNYCCEHCKKAWYDSVGVN